MLQLMFQYGKQSAFLDAIYHCLQVCIENILSFTDDSENFKPFCEKYNQKHYWHFLLTVFPRSESLLIGICKHKSLHRILNVSILQRHSMFKGPETYTFCIFITVINSKFAAVWSSSY